MSRKKVPFPYKKSFIDRARSVKMAGYWPRPFLASLFRVRLVHKHAKKDLGQNLTILTSPLVTFALFNNLPTSVSLVLYQLLYSKCFCCVSEGALSKCKPFFNPSLIPVAVPRDSLMRLEGQPNIFVFIFFFSKVSREAPFACLLIPNA